MNQGETDHVKCQTATIGGFCWDLVVVGKGAQKRVAIRAPKKLTKWWAPGGSCDDAELWSDVPADVSRELKESARALWEKCEDSTDQQDAVEAQTEGKDGPNDVTEATEGLAAAGNVECPSTTDPPLCEMIVVKFDENVMDSGGIVGTAKDHAYLFSSRVAADKFDQKIAKCMKRGQLYKLAVVLTPVGGE